MESLLQKEDGKRNAKISQPRGGILENQNKHWQL